MIQKFNRIEDADWPYKIIAPNDEYYKKVREFFNMSNRLGGLKVKRGIEKISDPFSKTNRNSN